MSRVYLVTGSNTGIGRATAVELASRGGHVVLANRSREKTLPVLEQIAALGRGSAEFLELDLADLASVRRAADTFLASDRPLHVLVNNAGLGGAHGLTKDGIELIFGTNHVGHFLFTLRLLDRLRASAPARIVNVASEAHYHASRIDWDAVRKPTASPTGMPEYRVSKLANVLFTKALARGRAGQGVKSYALHPGVVASDVWRKIPWPVREIWKMFLISNEEGAKTSIYCATSEEVADRDGLYYDKSKEKEPNPVVHDARLVDELWDKTTELVRAHL